MTAEKIYWDVLLNLLIIFGIICSLFAMSNPFKFISVFKLRKKNSDRISIPAAQWETAPLKMNTHLQTYDVENYNSRVYIRKLNTIAENTAFRPEETLTVNTICASLTTFEQVLPKIYDDRIHIIDYTDLIHHKNEFAPIVDEKLKVLYDAAFAAITNHRSSVFNGIRFFEFTHVLNIKGK